MPTVLVTGASRGLGFEFVRQYAGQDSTSSPVAAIRKRKSPAVALAAKNKNIEALEVTDAKSIEALAAET